MFVNVVCYNSFYLPPGVCVYTVCVCTTVVLQLLLLTVIKYKNYNK